MKINHLLLAYAVLATITSVFMLLAPEFWLFIHVVAADQHSTLLIRFVGALFGGLAVMTWASWQFEPSKYPSAMVLGLAVSSGLSAIVAILFATSGLYSNVIWVSVFVFSFFSIGFFLAGRSSAPDSHITQGNIAAG